MDQTEALLPEGLADVGEKGASDLPAAEVTALHWLVASLLGEATQCLEGN